LTDMDDDTAAQNAAEERRLWADYYEATARTLEIIRWEGTDGPSLPKIVAEDARAAAAIRRIKEIRGFKG
jgi:hypothetical protein